MAPRKKTSPIAAAPGPAARSSAKSGSATPSPDPAAAFSAGPRSIKVGPYDCGPGHPLVIIAGLCIIESREHTLRTAEALRKMTAGRNIQWVFKASFDKANRSSVDSYRGPGLVEGLKILAEVRRKFDVPVLTDIHEVSQVKAAARAVDVLQIPAFLCRQTDLLLAAGESGRTVAIKKGQFMAPADMRNAVEKVRSTGNDNVLLTERGASFGYNTLVVDFRSLQIMRNVCGVPVCFDATHSVQEPGGLGKATGGKREYIPALARAAAAVGVDSLFFEVHENPAKALSDGPNALPLDRFPDVLDIVVRIDELTRRGEVGKL